jgi:putative sterol carrier protein
MKGLGMKGDPKYPTPQEFVRLTHGLDGTEGKTVSMTPHAGAPSVNMSLLHSLSNGTPSGFSTNHVQLGPGIVVPPTTGAQQDFPANWGRCLEIILNSEFGANSVLEDDAFGVYKLEITETESGADTYFIELSATKREVTSLNLSGRQPDVSVSLSSPDLANILDGSLAPLQAYLTGRITANGDVRKLMFFDKLSKRGHKPGSMFTV